MLPKIAQPTIRCPLPSDKHSWQFRPMLYKEEKILRMARQGNETHEQFQALLDVVNACSMDLTKFDDRPVVDLEFAFTQLRAASISNVVEVSYEDGEDKVVNTFKVDLNKIGVKNPEGKDDSVELGPNLFLKLRYPPARVYCAKEMYSLDLEATAKFLVAACLDKIYEGDKITDFATQKPEEVQAWIDDLPIGHYNKIEDFMENVPTLEYTIEYLNTKGTARKIVLNTLDDFFTFG